MGTPIILADRVLVQTATAGTGTYSLGSAVAGYLDPAAAGVPSGSRVPYAVVDSLTAPTRMEVGEGVYTAGSPGTITRAQVRRNTAGGTSAESWPAGTKFLMLAPNAANLPTLETDGTLSAPSIAVANAIAAGTGVVATTGNVEATAGALVARASGAPTQGQVNLGSGGARLLFNGAAFDFSANVQVTGNVSWTSDRRAKEEVRPARLGLAQALRMWPVTFRRKGAKRGARRELGLIAQDAQAAHPLAVIRGQDGTLSVSAAAVDAILLAAVRDLAAEVEELRARLATMERTRRA